MFVHKIRLQIEYNDTQKDWYFLSILCFNFKCVFVRIYHLGRNTVYPRGKKIRNNQQAHLKSQIHLYYPILSLHQIQLIMSIQQITILVVDIRIFTIL